jgi:hypothetical protein
MFESRVAKVVAKAFCFALIIGSGEVALAQAQGDFTPGLSPGPDIYGLAGGPGVSILYTQTGFDPNSDDVKLNCVPASQPVTLLEFRMYTQNDGYADIQYDYVDNYSYYSGQIVDGLSVFSDNFASFTLIDPATGAIAARTFQKIPVTGKKNYFNLSNDTYMRYRYDEENNTDAHGPSSVPPQFLMSGWLDLYDVGNPCEYVQIDGLSSGTYDLVVEEDAFRLMACDTSNFFYNPASSSCPFDGRMYDNVNAMRVQVQIDQASVTPLAPVVGSPTQLGLSAAAGPPAVVTRNVGSYDLFYVGTDGNLYYIAQSPGPWPGGNGTHVQTPAGELLSGPLTAIATTRLRIDVFATAQSGDVIWVASLDGGTTWQSGSVIGSAAAGSGPIAVASGPESAMVAWLGTSGSVYYSLYAANSWSTPPQAMPGSFTASQTPALTASGDGMFHIFVENGAQVFYNRYWGGWQPHWGNVSPFVPPVGNLSAASPYLNRADVFARGSDNRLYRNTWNGVNDTFSGWIDDLGTDCLKYDASPPTPCPASLDTRVGSPPVAISTGVQSLDVFYYDAFTPNKLWRMHFDGTTATENNLTPAWQLTSLGQTWVVTPAWPVTAASWADHTFDIFEKYGANQITVQSMR